MFWDYSSPFSAYGPSFWHANGALIPDRMPNMPSFACQGLLFVPGFRRYSTGNPEQIEEPPGRLSLMSGLRLRA
jgi:hypothetical protein